MDKDKQKIKELEVVIESLRGELKHRESDLSVYQKEVERLNSALSEVLVGLDKDLSVLRNIFKYLVPAQFPHITGFNFSTKFVPGMRFNGDYIDVFEHADRFKFNLILSSSSGSILTALLIAFLLKHGRDSGEDGGAVNPRGFTRRVLDEIESKGQSLADIQLACCHIDKRTYEFSYKIHGKIFGFFQDGDSGKVEDLNALRSEDPIKLKPYDRIVLLSPGLVGCANEKGASFSVTPVLEAMAKIETTKSVHDLRNDIFFRLDQHLGKRRPLQDVSIIVMSIENNVIKLI